MKIGLYAPDSKIPNLPLMKISAYHKRKGDNVEIFSPLFDGSYDLVYISKIFKNTSIKYLPHKQNVILGGTGLSLKNVLDPEIEHIYPDYSIFNCNYAIGFLTRGCINKCEFCVVPEKEGFIHKHADLEEFWDGQDRLMLLDNSLTDYEFVDDELNRIIDLGIKLHISQGINVRTIKTKTAKLLSNIKYWDKNSQLHIAWDNIKDENSVRKGIDTLINAGIPRWRLMCYVLIGFNSSMNQDLYRINILKNLKIDPFVMVYRKNSYTKKIAKWINRKEIFYSTTFEEFCKSK